MLISRDGSSNRYGSFSRLVESTEEHGGYGNVTWNVGPHAGPRPYGPGRNIVFVPRDKLLANLAGGHSSSEVERHANEAGQVMDRGDVVHVPRLEVSGGKFKFSPKHLGAIKAAGGRGAEMVPVHYEAGPDAEDALMLNVGRKDKPGAPLPGQDPRFKWRWNGKGWYTKPSFNRGACPPGSSSGAGDRCVGAQPGSAPSAAEPDAAGGAAAAAPPAPTPPPPPPPAAPPSPPSPPPGAAAQSGPLGPFPRPGELDGTVPTGAIDKHSAIRDGTGLDGRMFPPNDVQDVEDEHREDYVQSFRKKMRSAMLKGLRVPDPRTYETHPLMRQWRDRAKASMKETADKAVVELQSKPSDERLDFDPNDYLGCGLSGCVYKGPTDPDGTPTVIKIDKGNNEGQMAQLMLDHPDLGRLSSVPRYIRAVPLSTVDRASGMETWAIQREDLEDIAELRRNPDGSATPVHQDPERVALSKFFGDLGTVGLGDISAQVGAALHGMRHLPDQHPLKRLAKRRALLWAHDRWSMIRDVAGDMARGLGPGVERQFNRVARDIDKLMKNGIFPCDLHADNWGWRASTGEVVMRDVGCAHFIN